MSNWDPENYDEGLEVLLDKTDMKTEASTSIQAKEKAHINAFDNQINREGNKLNKVFLSPFERYGHIITLHCLFMDLNFKAELEMACFIDIQIPIGTVS